MESGTPLCLWSVSPPGWARRRARALSTIAGCPEESGELAECLREKPAELLVDLFYNFFVNNTFDFSKINPPLYVHTYVRIYLQKYDRYTRPSCTSVFVINLWFSRYVSSIALKTKNTEIVSEHGTGTIVFRILKIGPATARP